MGGKVGMPAMQICREVMIWYALRSLRTLSVQVVVGLIVGGIVGNLVDRFRFGYVVDFLDLRWWPVFNVADSAISVSMAVIVISMLLHGERS